MDPEYENRFSEEIISDTDEEGEDTVQELGKSLSSCTISLRYVLSIDIGITHFAFSVSTFTRDYEYGSLQDFFLLDITRYICTSSCTLYHTKTFTDWICHLVHTYYSLFEKAEVILIEKQPVHSPLVGIEQLLYGIFRHKAVLVQPKSVHVYFNMGNADYKKRKELSVKTGEKYIPAVLKRKYVGLERQHDITDTILFVLFWLSNKKKEVEEEIKRKRAEIKTRKIMKSKVIGMNMTTEQFFENHRYRGT